MSNLTNNKMNDINNLCLGIDFGTTNSCISVWYKNKAIIVYDIDDSTVIPTVISIGNNKKIIGKEAYLRKNIFDNNKNKKVLLIYEIKKLLGKKFSELNKNYIDILAYNITSDDNDNIMIYDDETDKYYYIEEIATHLFMSFKTKAEAFLTAKFNNEINVDDVVISVPATFNKNQREIIKNCAKNANFNILRLINEPTAAALCYGLGKNLNNSNKHIIVYDLGGGTLDICLVYISEGVYEILASCGNTNLGGSDFDKNIMEYVINEFIEQNKINKDEFFENIEENALQKLKFLSEQIKISLTENLKATLRIDNFYDNKNLKIEITREKFNQICEDLLIASIKPLNELLELCEIEKDKIDEIIMVGGMTRIPIIRYNVERFFNKDVNCSIDPDTVVSIGAAIQGHMLKSNESLDDKLLLVDRTSLSIGLETSGGIMDVLISRGTIIPVKKTRKYTTDMDNTEWINIKIYEGERKLTKDNYLIGEFILSGIEKEKRGIPEIQITFEIDSDGIIKIKAEDLKNPLNKKTIQVSGNKQNLSQEQLDEIIENAKLMDKIDRLDKKLKESYISLIDSSKRILENINSDDLKLQNDIKNVISENVSSILNWLLQTQYNDITLDKYKEIMDDYKTNYSIYLIHNSAPIINLDSSNEEETKGIEIYDDEMNKKYIEQINYFRTIINEYDTIKKQINMYEYMDFGDKNDDKNKIVEQITNLFNNLYDFANDILIKLFIEDKLTDDIVNEYCIKMNNYDNEFKDLYNILDNECNIVNKLVNKIKEKEDYYLNKLSSETNEHNIELINSKLDEIIKYESYLYKINNGYIKYEFEKINNLFNQLDNL